MMRTVTASAILRAVRAAGWDAYCEQTGGGCATVCASRPGRGMVLIGPGSYDWRDPVLSTFALGDLYIGPDDDGESEPVAVRTLATIADYLRAYATWPDHARVCRDDCEGRPATY